MADSAATVAEEHAASVNLDQYLSYCRDVVLEEIKRVIPERPPYSEVLYDLMLEYPLRSAKALRPALCIATCRALGGRLQAVLPTAAVVELYHNAFLIHDDVEDQSELRRQGPTLHRQYGVPVAVNVGDAMLALTLRPLLDNMSLLGMGPSLRILMTVARMATESAEGQAVELDWIRRGTWKLGDDDYIEMVRKKTAWYTFVTPMLLGAQVAGANAEQLSALESFALDLGVAFQIHDDVLNIAGQEESYGKEIGGDLWEGKHTLILLHTMRVAEDSERNAAQAILAKPRPSSTNSETLEAHLNRLVEAGDLTPQGRSELGRALYVSAAAAKTTDEVGFLDDLIRRHDSVAYARDVAEGFALRAQEKLRAMGSWLPESVDAAVITRLVSFVIERDR